MLRRLTEASIETWVYERGANLARAELLIGLVVETISEEMVGAFPNRYYKLLA